MCKVLVNVSSKYAYLIMCLHILGTFSSLMAFPLFPSFSECCFALSSFVECMIVHGVVVEISWCALFVLLLFSFFVVVVVVVVGFALFLF